MMNNLTSLTCLVFMLLCSKICAQDQPSSVGALEIVIGYSASATVVVQPLADAHGVIQQSLDDMKIHGSGRLRFEPGTFILSSYIELGSNTEIIGAGINVTTLKLMDNADPWWKPNTGFKRSGFIRSMLSYNLYFANITIDGNKQNQKLDKYSIYGRYGFYTEACHNVTIDGMAIINFQGYGFDPHGDKSSMEWSTLLTITNSYAGDNDWDGFTIDQSADVTLINNTAMYNGRHGFNIVTGSRYVHMENIVSTSNGYYYYAGNPGCGVMIQNNLYFGTHDVSVHKAVITDNFGSGICVTDVSNITLTSNVITNVTERNLYCIKIINSTNVVTDNNSCNDKLYPDQPSRQPSPPTLQLTPPSPPTLQLTPPTPTPPTPPPPPPVPTPKRRDNTKLLILIIVPTVGGLLVLLGCLILMTYPFDRISNPTNNV